MPFDRRRFLAGTGAAASLAPLAGFSTPAGPAGFVVVDPGVPESLSFAADYAVDARIPCRLDDPMPMHAALGRALRGHTCVAGCTRDAGAFIVGELLRGEGFRLEIIGRHRQIDAATWRHDVHLRRAVDVPHLFAQRDWPRRLAAALHVRGSRPAGSPQAIETAMPGIPGSPGYLTSWRIVTV